MRAAEKVAGRIARGSAGNPLLAGFLRFPSRASDRDDGSFAPWHGLREDVFGLECDRVPRERVHPRHVQREDLPYVLLYKFGKSCVLAEARDAFEIAIHNMRNF